MYRKQRWSSPAREHVERYLNVPATVFCHFLYGVNLQLVLLFNFFCTKTFGIMSSRKYANEKVSTEFSFLKKVCNDYVCCHLPCIVGAIISLIM